MRSKQHAPANPRAALIAALALVAVFTAAVIIRDASAGVAPTGPGSMQAMRFDMDATGNAATSLGPVEDCARINENNNLDADEDATADTVEFDITASGIPDEQVGSPGHSSRMIGFNVAFTYNEVQLTVQDVDTGLLLASTAGSSVFDVSDITPDTLDDGAFLAAALDTGIAETSSESGSGVLARLRISSDPGANPGQYPLAFNPGDGVLHLDTAAEDWAPLGMTNGSIAIDQPCGAPTPTPTASPTPTPSPSPSPPGSPTPTTPLPTETPSGQPRKGDVQCDGDIDPVDALMDLRFVAALQTTQVQPCPAIGGEASRGPVAGAGSATWGDMDCDDDVDSVDALFILRHVAELPVDLPAFCAAIGS
jgi:hypothetical protein